MFFALRDLRTARWRFALITGVVLLLSVLVSGLLGLTAGLAHQSVSALRALGSGGTAFVLPADDSGQYIRQHIQDSENACPVLKCLGKSLPNCL